MYINTHTHTYVYIYICILNTYIHTWSYMYSMCIFTFYVCVLTLHRKAGNLIMTQSTTTSLSLSSFSLSASLFRSPTFLAIMSSWSPHWTTKKTSTCFKVKEWNCSVPVPKDCLSTECHYHLPGAYSVSCLKNALFQHIYIVACLGLFVCGSQKLFLTWNPCTYFLNQPWTRKLFDTMSEINSNLQKLVPN